MSVVSQRVPHPYRTNRHGRPPNGAHSVIGYELDRSPLIMPGFSGIDEVGVTIRIFNLHPNLLAQCQDKYGG